LTDLDPSPILVGERIDMSTSSSSSGGVGCLSLLGILFIALKLLGKITWSWWWVLSPFIINAVIIIILIIVVLAIAIWVKK